MALTPEEASILHGCTSRNVADLKAEEDMRKTEKDTAIEKKTVTLDEEIFHEIKLQLEELGVPMEGCPPMWYPEAIHNLFVWTVFATRECVALHDFHHGNNMEIRVCLKDRIQTYAKQNSKDSA